MSDDAIAAHIRSLEEALLDPGIRRDPAKVSALLAEEFREFGSSGREWSRQQIIDSLATEEYTRPYLEDFRCETVAPDVALVTYRTVRIHPATAQKSAALRSSLWIREAGTWRVRFHQGTPQR